MTNKEHLIEQHILEYESRMKHIDELYQRAHEAAEKLDSAHDARARLDELTAQHSLLRETTESLKTMPLDNLREATVHNAGPMAVWDILAQKLEDFVERHE